MSINKQRLITIIALFVTAFIFIFPGYLFSNEVSDLAAKGWSFYNEKAINVSDQLEEIKSVKLSGLFSDDAEISDEASNGTHSPIGYIRVISTKANIRATPEVPADPEENIVSVAQEGQELPYFGTETTDEGNIWYKLMDSDTGEASWISEVTVEIVK